jgi:hypothetical protein
VTEQRRAKEFAECLKEVVDTHFPEAEQIRLVTDNLNTHSPAALYATFPAEEARRIARKVEWHYTPKHASWLDMAEVEISVLGRQCLDRRIEDRATLEREVAAWEARRNAAKAKVDWQFTTGKAREKLKRLYPS